MIHFSPSGIRRLLATALFLFLSISAAIVVADPPAEEPLPDSATADDDEARLQQRLAELDELTAELTTRQEELASERQFQQRLVAYLGRRFDSPDTALDVATSTVTIGLLNAEEASLDAAAARINDEQTRVDTSLQELIAARRAAIDDDDLRRLEEAEAAQEAARRAAQEAQLREERERDEEMRALLRQERTLNEELARLAETQGERIRSISESRSQSADLFTSRRTELTDALDADNLNAIDAALFEARTYRRSARQDLLEARAALRQIHAELPELDSALTRRQREQQQLLAELGTSILAELPAQRLAIAQLQIDLASRKLRGAQDLHEELQRRKDLQHERVQFFHHTFRDLFARASSDARAQITTPFSDQNWSDLRVGLQISAGNARELLSARIDQFFNLPEHILSASFWGWTLGAAWRLLLFFGLLWLVRKEGTNLLSATLRFLFRRRALRRRAALLVRISKGVKAILLPISALLGMLLLLDYFALIFPEITYLTWLVELGFYYWIPAAAITALLGTSSRHSSHDGLQLGKGPNTDRHTIDRSLAAGPLLRQKTRRSVRSVKILLFSFLLFFFIPRFIWELAGPSPLWWIVRLGTLFFLIATIYGVLSNWRDEIAQAFRRHAEERAPRVANFVQDRKDGFAGVLIIALATVALILFEISGFFYRLFTSSEAHRQITNFLFRKRIEIQQRQREQQLRDNNVEPLATIPNHYRTFFSVRPLLNEPFQIRRQEPLDALAKQFQRFRSTGRQGSLALVGESGIGKTTLLNQAIQGDTFQNAHPIYLTITEKITTEADALHFLVQLFGLSDDFKEASRADLIDAIGKEPSRVIILDAAHHFFLRQIGGFQAINLLLEIVQFTAFQHFWILSFNRFSWNYLNRVQARRHYFGHILPLSPWSETEIQDLIRQRDAMIDLDISFSELVVDDDGLDKSYEVIRTSNGYFRLLHEYSLGNPEVALVFWLRSLRLDDNGHLQVGLFSRPTPQQLLDLGDPYLFSLAAIAQHSGLSPKEVATIINSDVSQCETMLNFLREAEIIAPFGLSGRCRVRPEFLRLVLRQLSISNFLYE